MQYAQYRINTLPSQYEVGGGEVVALHPHQSVKTSLSQVLLALEEGDLHGAITFLHHLLGTQYDGYSLRLPKHTGKNTVISNEYANNRYSEEPLKIYTLGRFAVIREGQRIQFRGKAQKRPLDLLKSIIALGGRGISKQHIAELIWPDSEGDAAVTVINTTLSRLRKLIGKNAITTENGRVSLNPDYCWVDCWELEKVLNSIKEQDHVSGDASIEVKKALDLYQGSFLAGDDDGWLVSRRERLRSRFLHILSQHGQLLVESGQCDAAIILYSTALEIDDLNEIFYINLMRCLQHKGRNSEAIRVYQRCRKTLHDILAIEPSVECTALYTTMMKGL